MSSQNCKLGMPPVDCRLLVSKASRSLSVLVGTDVKLIYPVAIGRNAADKAFEGDHATPTGDFFVCAKNPRSKFFLSVCLSYPNAEDAERGLATGLIDVEEHTQILDAIRCQRMPPQHTRLGGEIYIHGSPVDGSVVTSTRGCIALENRAMREVFDRVVIGTRVLIT
jgi:murein L,D-transpeptidase YafK